MRKDVLICGVLALAAAAVAIATSPNSYAHLFITGKCFKEPMPLACHPRSLRSAGPAGRIR